MIFKNYDENSTSILYKSDIELMISHIIFVFLSALPHFALSKSVSSTTLEEYASQLNLFINSLLKYFVSKMMGGLNELTKDEFIHCFDDEELSFLMNGKKLRIFCKQLFLKFTSKKDISFCFQHNAKDLETYSSRLHHSGSSAVLGPHHKNSLSLS